MVVLQIALGVVRRRKVTIVVGERLTVCHFLLFTRFNRHLNVLRVCRADLLGMVVVVRLFGISGKSGSLGSIDILKLYRLCFGIVKHGWVFDNTIHSTLFTVTSTDIDGHGDALQIMERIHDLAENDNRLHAEVYKEGYGCQC